MKKHSFFSLLALILLASTSLFAQEANRPDDKSDKKASLKIGADYISNNVFMGRSDTAAKPIFAPNITYTFAFGLYLTAAADFIPSRQTNKLDDGNIGAGYNYTVGKFDGSISFTKMFYAATSTQVASSVSSETAASIEFSNDYITPGIAFNFAKGKGTSRNDYFLNPSLNHEFIFVQLFGDKDYLSITPAASLNAGTQNFYDSYFARANKVKHQKTSAVLAAYRQNLTKFKLLDYEFSAPVEYSFRPFMISFTPTLAIPENKLPKTITNSQSTKAELFYFDLGLSLKF